MSDFDMESYQRFLAAKAPRAVAAGIDPGPMIEALFDYQRAATEFCLQQGRAALFLDTGLGKALASDTNVVTPTGYKPIRDLSVGDYVIGANGQPTRVEGVFPQGVRDAYGVTFSDDASLVCDTEHLWNVRTKVQKYCEGIGSEGVVALRERRRFVGVELKEAYWKLACKHLDGAEAGASTLFDLAAD